MSIMCNAGLTKTKLVGDLPGFGEVWFNPNGIANILSMSQVEREFPITYENQNFTIHKTDGTKRHFTKSEQGLYYLDAAASLKNTGVVLVDTVADKKSSYSNKDYSQAVLARKVQDMIGRPSLKTFLKVVENNLLMNCPITRNNVVAAEDLFGPNLGSLKGKTTRRTSPRVRPENHSIPLGIMEKY
jgi:hypothetical protein